MKNIELYSSVKIIIDVKTRSSKPFIVKAGTTGTVLDIEQNPKTKEKEYLIELDNEAFEDVKVEYFKSNEIELINL